ncbi:aspartoacylase [Psychrobium sp. 1_MG-2023]|uniref:aspartoacylase n=1 Tax=Psychrobium sp. 1_MG-2023 TaxID=3062624 RepID=UPI000C34C425|nr:aspartoacylase [Psychrobium sp. 1_MG-2023]MDP2559677.1 aspartoacylase [Psychrobium sp. 1_MG-2023]PKF59508.1 aspartoacylase [Alteromonadales bacterium alter-6D02]
MIKQLAIVGGTHGNEFTGIYLLQKWQKNQALIARSTFETETLFANAQAYQQNKRYIDHDLNRCFSHQDLADSSLDSIEQTRAKEINQLLGPKGNPRVDFIIDLHTTTTNMGPTLLITKKGKFYNQLAAYVKMHMPEAMISCDEDHKTNDEHHFLSTVAQDSVMVEVGPVPQSVLRHDVFEQSEQMTLLILDFIELHNKGEVPKLPETVDAYRYLESIKLPLTATGERAGMVHRDIQDKDFAKIEPGQVIFVTFDGEEITYQGDKAVYGSFINEAAYYDNNLAMSLLEKTTLSTTADD